MNKSIKKIALSLLLALTAIVLCVLGSNIFNNKSLSADAASASVTDVVVTADKTNAEADETITFTITITSGFGSDMHWSALSFVVSPLGSDGLPSDNNKYFKWNSTYGSLGTGNESNIIVWNDEGYYEYTYDDYSNYQDGSNQAKKGFNVSLVENDDSYTFPANTPIVIKYQVTVASDAPNSIGNLSFGVAALNSNAIQYNNSSSSNAVTHRAAEGGINCTPAVIRIGKVSSDATLKSLSVGASSASTAVTIADSMTYVNADTGTSFKFKAAVNDSTASMKYCVGTGTPTTALTNDTETSITLDSSGETTLKILVTAEDTTTTKTYTLAIKSSYARLSALAVTINRPASADAVSGMGLQSTFDKDTTSYTVKVPSDNTSVEVTPTILSGYGATGVAVTATNCTSDVTTISTKGTITNIKDGGTLALTVTAKDGSTTKSYTLTFSVVNVDTSIKTFTMTESTTGTTVNSDTAKATANSVDYYFLLSEESGFKGKFNMTLNAATSSATVDGTAYSSTTERSAATYTIVVTAQGGNTKTYKVMVVKDLKPGYIANLKYKIGSSSAADVLTDSGTVFDSATTTYTMTKEFDPATYPANTSFVLTGTASEGATVTATSITGGSGTWTKSLSLGTNEFNLKANVDGVGSTTYKFVIKLVEKKNSITSMTLKQGTNTVSGFSFNSSQTSYTLTVPYKDYGTINIEAVSDGVLTTLKAEIGGSTQTFSHTADTTSHILSSVALTAGAVTTIKVYGIADNGSGDKGTEYTIAITRTAADTNAKLQTLNVSVDGTPISTYDGGVTFDPDTLTYTYTIEPTGNSTASIVIAATAQSDKATVTGTGTQSFTFGTTSKTETYTITVTPESGTSDKKEYKVNIKRVVQAGDFTEIKVSTDSSNYTSIFSGFDALKSQTLSYNVSDVPVGTTFSVTVTLNTPDASVGSLTGLSKSGDVYAGKLTKFGLNTFKIAATSSLGSTTYTINVNLFEDKHDISDVAILDSTGTALSGFVFNNYQDNYSLDLPFTTSSVTVKVTPDGTYNVICETGNKALTKNGTIYEKTVALTAGSTTTLVVYGVANNGTGLSTDSTATSTKYTFKFNRAAADTSTTLSQLSVKINGVEKEYKDVITFDPNLNNYVIEIEKEGTSNTASVVLTAVPTVETSTVKCDSVLMTSTTVTKTFTFQNNVEHETTYEFLVTAQSGTTNTYTVTIKRIIIEGDFTALEFAESGSTYEDVFTSSRYDDFEKTYTADLSTDTVAEGSTIKIKATVTNGATASQTGGLTLSAGVWSAKLVHGENVFTLTSTSATGSTTYTFIVNLYENKKDIDNITLTSGSSTLSSDLFSFSKGQTTYRFSVPYTTESLKMTVTTDGYYTAVVDNSGATFTKPTSTGRNHEKTIDLVAGGVTTLLVHGVSDKDEMGTEYVFEITRAAVNTNAKLQTLEVTIDGTPITEFDGGVTFDPDTLTYTYTIESTGKTSVPIVIAATAQSDKATVTGTGTKTFTFGTTSKTETYTITVTPESGAANKQEYKINIKRVVQGGDFTDIEVSTDGSNYTSIFPDFDDSKSQTLSYNVSDVSVNTTFRVKVTLAPDASVGSLTGLTKNGDVYSGKLTKFGLNTFKIAATSSAGSTTYTINVNLYEDKQDITDIVVLDTKNAAISGFTFNSYQNTYTIDLPFAIDCVIVKVTPDGTYNVICETGNKALTKNGTVYQKTLNLTAGSTTTLVVYGVANEGTGLSTDSTATGTEYTLNFNRAAANTSTTLKELSVKINGVEKEYKDVIIFNPNTNNYVIEIEKEGTANTATVAFTAVPTVSTSTVKLDGVAMTSTTASKTFTFQNVAEHETTYEFLVTSESGETNTYTVTIKRITKLGDFTALEFAESTVYENVFTSLRYNEFEKTYTADLSTDKIAEGSTVRIKATSTTGATVTQTGGLALQSGVWAGKLVHGVNVFTLTASSLTGETNYTFIVNLFEEKQDIEKITITSNGINLSTDLFSFNKEKTSYRFSVPYTVESLKMVVETNGIYTIVVDNSGAELKKPTSTGRSHEKTIELTEGSVTTLIIHGVSDKDESGTEYVFEITRLTKGEIVGPDTEIYIDDEEITSFVLSSGDTVLHVLDGYSYKKDKLKFQVDFAYGGKYEIKRISEDGVVTIMAGETDTGKFKNVKLDFGTNVFSVDIVSIDGQTKKSAIFVVDRGEPTLESISALEIPTLKNDFNQDPYNSAFSYSVSSNVDKLTLDVDVDKDLFTYDVVGADKLEYGMNEVLVNIYANSSGRAATEPLKTITLSVNRERNNFWLIMFCVTAALALVELIIVAILLARKNRNDGGNDPEFIYASAPVEPQTITPPPIILQLPPQN
ncbi:MAG: beta strand repeat-containing protein [Candidatus Coproplasma sp.]